MSKTKYIVLVGDGMADYPIEELAERPLFRRLKPRTWIALPHAV